MAEYIEREAVKKVIADVMSDCKVEHKHRALNRNIKKIHSADVVEVRHGEWVREDIYFYHRYNCSACGYRLIGEPTKFCEDCGAKMDGKDGQ